MQTATIAKKPRKQAISGRFWAGHTYRGRIKDDHKIDIVVVFDGHIYNEARSSKGGNENVRDSSDRQDSSTAADRSDGHRGIPFQSRNGSVGICDRSGTSAHPWL